MDISNVVDLRDWSVQTPDPWAAPEMGLTSLAGVCYGHPKFRDGDHIITSPIRKVDGRLITTAFSTYYLAGPPSQAYQEWCKNHNIVIDPTNPIKVR